MSLFHRSLWCFCLLSLYSFANAAYIKVSNIGKSLTNSAVLGSGPNDWACTYDSETGFLWEVKTDDGGLRDKDWSYTWYDPKSPAGVGAENSEFSQYCDKKSYCNTWDYIQRVNAQGLCGGRSWRMPTKDELGGLFSGGKPPFIDKTYFPNTKTWWYWSSSLNNTNGNTSDVWTQHFQDYVFNTPNPKNSEGYVRLMHRGLYFDPVDTTPDIFTFKEQTAVEQHATITSNTITVSGINAVTNIGIENGEFKINDGGWGNAEATVNKDDKVTVRHTSADGSYQTMITKLTIGGISTQFKSTTSGFTSDTTPDIFSFTEQAGVAQKSIIVSNTIIVEGINATASIFIKNGEFKINGGSWISTNTTVNKGDVITIRHTSASGFNQSVVTTLTIGNVSASFKSTTAPIPPTVSRGNGTGYVEGKVFDACNQTPLKSVKLTFNGTTQQSDLDGHYLIELDSGSYTIKVTYPNYQSDSQSVDLATNEKRIRNFNLLPTAGCDNVQPAKTRQAIIVSGSGPLLASGENHIWDSTQSLADRAYTSLRLQKFRREDIYYLTADPQLTSRDADGDGANDIYGAATTENIQQALTQWAGNVEQVLVYFIGHGGVNSFQLNRTTELTPTQLKPWLDSLQSKLSKDQRGQPGKMTVIFDACKSGSFVAPLAASNRYIVASTQPNLDAIVSNKDGSNSFSYHFWGQIGFKDGWLSKAFQQARQSMSSELVDRGKTQNAMLDADGSGDFTASDYSVIGNYCYGDCIPHASVSVVIDSVSPLDNLHGQLSNTLTVKASKVIDKAWVSIQRPDYHFPSNGTAIASLLNVPLTCSSSNTCQGQYNNFNINDDYQVTFYVVDKDGNDAVPYTLNLNQNGIERSNDKKNALAVYEPSTGILTLKDVTAGSQHYYVELKDQGGYKFALQNLYPLNEATTTTPANFDGKKVTIPSVFAFGGYFVVDLVSNGSTFAVTRADPK